MDEPLEWLIALCALGVILLCLSAKRAQMIFLVLGWGGCFAAGLAAIFTTGYAVPIFIFAIIALLIAGGKALAARHNDGG